MELNTHRCPGNNGRALSLRRFRNSEAARIGAGQYRETKMGKVVVTPQYRPHSSPAWYHRLEQALFDIGRMHHTIVTQSNSATSTHREQYSRRRTNRDIIGQKEEDYAGYAHRSTCTHHRRPP